jgi:hypothetical protein
MESTQNMHDLIKYRSSVTGLLKVLRNSVKSVKGICFTLLEIFILLVSLEGYKIRFVSLLSWNYLLQ